MNDDDDVVYSQIRLIQFGTWDPDVVLKMSVAKIHSSEAFEDGNPKAGGLFDPKMGPIEKKVYCVTCDKKMQECPGHFAHIELAVPVFHPGFIDHALHVMRSICHCCSELLIDKKEIKVKKLRQISKQVMTKKSIYKTCKNCGQDQRKYNKDGLKIVATVFTEEDDEGGKKKKIITKIEITPSKCLNILEKISDIDAQYMGFTKWCKPHWLILDKLPVPPPAVRPSVLMDASRRGDDDLTQKLNDIIKTNNIYLKHERDGSPAEILMSVFCLLRYHVATYIDNEIPSVETAQQRSGRDLKALSQRLKGKEGRVRHNLMGKRVDFSARTVIGGDPNIGIEEIGVPLKIAMNLSYPEVVTKRNLKWLYQLVRNGPFEYPGANRIIKKGAGDFLLRHVKDPSITNLEVGDIVERHLIDGDLIVFNRQPSLHRMSMMGHKVRVMKHNTFRLNLSVTTPYNADFDGKLVAINSGLPQ